MHEKIIKRDDGSKVKIRIGFNQKHWGSMSIDWQFQTLLCLPRKRTWVNPVTDTFRRRGLTLEEKQAQDQKAWLTLASPEEIHEVMLEAWEALKPEKP